MKPGEVQPPQPPWSVRNSPGKLKGAAKWKPGGPSEQPWQSLSNTTMSGFREVDTEGAEAFAVVVGVDHPASAFNYGEREGHLIQSSVEDETSVEDGLNIGVR